MNLRQGVSRELRSRNGCVLTEVSQGVEWIYGRANLEKVFSIPGDDHTESLVL
jgi:hypothetical protein